MRVIDCRRPKALYRFSQRQWLEKSLRHGEFRLAPASSYKDIEGDVARQDDERCRITQLHNPVLTLAKTGERIIPIGPVTRTSRIETDYYLLCFSKIYHESLYKDFQGADACLVVRSPDVFCERIHDAVEAALPGWAGIDAAVTYGADSQLGAAFSKNEKYMFQLEWRFAWYPPEKRELLNPRIVSIGPIDDCAEILEKPA